MRAVVDHLRADGNVSLIGLWGHSMGAVSSLMYGAEDPPIAGMVLDKSFEFHDANTICLFGELVLAQKVMYERFGNDFLISFVSKGFLGAHCPQDLAEQYCQKLQGNDMKSLKSFYQSLIENLRVQQNGSLVFR